MITFGEIHVRCLKHGNLRLSAELQRASRMFTKGYDRIRNGHRMRCASRGLYGRSLLIRVRILA
jgi:hypothetical protein